MTKYEEPPPKGAIDIQETSVVPLILFTVALYAGIIGVWLVVWLR